MAKQFTLAELSHLTKAKLIGNPSLCISGVDALESAKPEDASFFANPLYRQAMLESAAGVICVDPSVSPIEGRNFLISQDPSLTFQIIVEQFFPYEYEHSAFTGIHPTAVIYKDAVIGKDVQIGPYVVIDKGVKIGDRTHITASVSIGPNVEIGSDCLFHPHVVIRERCIIGNRVILQPGCVIGSCGFGYLTDASGKHTKLHQRGNVMIDDDVEVGANTTIDRARFKTTHIAHGTKIDNLVQIGHNVQLGQDNIIVSQSGISGSAKTGRNVIVGGQAGIVGHVEIADHAMSTARGGISKSLTKAGKYSGSPVMPLAEHNRQQVHLRKIAEYVKQIDALEKRLSKLEGAFGPQ